MGASEERSHRHRGEHRHEGDEDDDAPGAWSHGRKPAIAQWAPSRRVLIGSIAKYSTNSTEMSHMSGCSLRA